MVTTVTFKRICAQRFQNISDGEFIVDESWIDVASGRNGLDVAVERCPGIYHSCPFSLSFAGEKANQRKAGSDIIIYLTFCDPFSKDVGFITLDRLNAISNSGI